jgi:hypothetical protein
LGDALTKALANRLAESKKRTASNWPTPEEIKNRENRQQTESEKRQQSTKLEMRNLADVEMKRPEVPKKGANSCFFRIDCKPRDLTFKPIDKESAHSVPSDQLEKLRISACLFGLAAHAGSPDEASYLSDEAARALRGDEVRVETAKCQKTSSPDTVQGKPVNDLNPEQMTLYTKLLESAQRETSNLARIDKHLKETAATETKTKALVLEKQGVVEQLHQQPIAADDSESQRKRDALAEAEAALEQAKRAEAEAEQAIGQDRAEETKSMNNLKLIQSCSEQARSDPAKTGELLKTCGI